MPLCIVSSFLYAYFAAFRKDVDGGPENMESSGYTDRDIKVFDNIQGVIEGMFLVDMCIEFVLEFHDDITNTNVRDIT